MRGGEKEELSILYHIKTLIYHHKKSLFKTFLTCTHHHIQINSVTLITLRKIPWLNSLTRVTCPIYSLYLPVPSLLDLEPQFPPTLSTAPVIGGIVNISLSSLLPKRSFNNTDVLYIHYQPPSPPPEKNGNAKNYNGTEIIRISITPASYSLSLNIPFKHTQSYSLLIIISVNYSFSHYL